MNILVIDDEANIRKTVKMYLKSSGHSCSVASGLEEALQCSRKDRFDVAFLDLRLGTDNGLDLISSLLGDNPELKIVVMTAYSSVDTAVSAMKLGAFDYIGKPFNPAQIDVILAKAEKIRNMENRLSSLDSDLKALHPEGILDSANPAMRRILEMAHQVAGSDAIVLLRGESGTGKTVLAKAIHRWSRRADAPFGVVSCPSLSPELLASELFGHVRGAFTGAVKDNSGRIAACDHGTLFLDEIGDLPPAIQPQLLRFIQDKEYEPVGSSQTHRADVRIIAATNVPLEEAVREKRFREDLFFRLNVFQLEIPPLRERPEDIDGLAAEMLAFFARNNHKHIVGFSEAAMQALHAYSWPGNLRELRNAVERGVILAVGNTVELAHLPETLYASETSRQTDEMCTLSELEKHHIARVIAATASLQEAAEKLGIDQTTLWRKRKQYGL
ncbi:MAG: sigma-54-dependent transcriptional regulator [Victivallaceae bacterium]